MKVQRKISPTTIIEADGQTVADVFEALARLEDVFHGHEVCGACQAGNVTYQMRTDKDGNKYYQAHCLKCHAEFRFGVRREGNGVLFPQYKDADGNVKPNGGWVRFQPRDGGADAETSGRKTPQGGSGTAPAKGAKNGWQ